MQITNNANTADIANLFTKAQIERKAVLVRGYVSSDGSVKDKLVMPLPKYGYAEMCRMAYTLVSQDELERGEHDAAVWDKVKKDRLSAWDKFMEPGMADIAPLRSKYKLRQVTDNVHQADDAPGTTIVAQLGDVGPHTVERKPSKDPAVNAKAWLEDQTPVSEYSGQLILNKEKFASAELVDAPQDSWTYKLFYCENC